MISYEYQHVYTHDSSLLTKQNSKEYDSHPVLVSFSIGDVIHSVRCYLSRYAFQRLITRQNLGIFECGKVIDGYRYLTFIIGNHSNQHCNDSDYRVYDL